MIFESNIPENDPDTAPANVPGNTDEISNSESAEIIANAMAEYQAAINTHIESGNVYSQELSEQYEALGIMLYLSGDNERALEVFDEALQIHKINKGLFNLDQTPVIEYQINVYTKLGDFPAVDNLKHYLYYIQNKNLNEDDPRLIVAKQEWADWNIEAYTKGYRNTYISPLSFQDSINAVGRLNNQVTIPFRIVLPENTAEDFNLDTNPTAGATITANMPLLNSNAAMTSMAVTDYNIRSIPIALSSDLVINQRLYDAENIYRDLLAQVERDRPDALMEQQQIHQKIANVNYLLKKELQMYERADNQGSIAYNRVNQEFTSDATMMADRRYVQTKNTFTDLVEDIENAIDTTPSQKADAYISLGDMHLSFNRPRRAFDAYNAAYSILVDSGISSAEAAGRITPVPDIAVPAYGVHSFSREFFRISPETDIPYKGFIDVSFAKDRFGNISAINVLGSSESTPAAVRTALINYLRNQQFRPNIINGEAVSEEAIQLRYHYYY